jgi:DDE superfamily endonuclease
VTALATRHAACGYAQVTARQGWQGEHRRCLLKPPLNGFPPMLPDATLQVPASVMTLLSAFAPLFTAPSFRTFCGLACGFLAQPGRRTVCGMLTGAGLSRLWPHDRAHYFFSRARWSPDDLGLAAARLVVSLLVPAGAPVDVAVDDTLFRRCGKKVWAASWFHDGSAQGPAKTGYGNNWVILAVIVRLPGISRPVGIPVMAKLVIKVSNSKSRLWLARRMAERLAGAMPDRKVRVTADSAYAGDELKGLPAGVSWTTRLRKDAALHGLPPARTGRPGPAPGEGGTAPVAGETGRSRRVLSGHRHPLPQDRGHRGRRRHVPVVFRVRLPARHCRARP